MAALEIFGDPKPSEHSSSDDSQRCRHRSAPPSVARISPTRRTPVSASKSVYTPPKTACSHSLTSCHPVLTPSCVAGSATFTGRAAVSCGHGGSQISDRGMPGLRREWAGRARSIAAGGGDDEDWRHPRRRRGRPRYRTPSPPAVPAHHSSLAGPPGPGVEHPGAPGTGKKGLTVSWNFRSKNPLLLFIKVEKIHPMFKKFINRLPTKACLDLCYAWRRCWSSAIVSRRPLPGMGIDADRMFKN